MTSMTNRNNIIAAFKRISIVMMVVGGCFSASKAGEGFCSWHPAESNPLIYESPTFNNFRLFNSFFVVSSDCNDAPFIWVINCPSRGVLCSFSPPFFIRGPLRGVPFTICLTGAFSALTSPAVQSARLFTKVFQWEFGFTGCAALIHTKNIPLLMN